MKEKKKRRCFGLFSYGRRLAELEARLDALEGQEDGGTASPYVENADVPLSRVIREYLWGEEEK